MGEIQREIVFSQRFEVSFSSTVTRGRS